MKSNELVLSTAGVIWLCACVRAGHTVELVRVLSAHNLDASRMLVPVSVLLLEYMHDMTVILEISTYPEPEKHLR